jgi:enolase
MAVDAAAEELFDGGTYVFRKSMRRRRTTDQMIQFYEIWLKHLSALVDLRWARRD